MPKNDMMTKVAQHDSNNYSFKYRKAKWKKRQKT